MNVRGGSARKLSVSFVLKCAKLNVCVCGFLNIHYVKRGDQNGVAEWNL